MTAPLTAVQALSAVMADVQAVRKGERNAQQGFNFRGVDAVVNAVGPAFRTHGVVVGSEVLAHTFTEVEVGTKRTPMGHAMVTVRYRFYGPAGDFVEASAAAEAMDSGDKATAKAMSVAYRTALIQALALPTDEPDPDAESFERAPQQTAPEGQSVAPRQGQRQTPSGDLNGLKSQIAAAMPGKTPTQIKSYVTKATRKNPDDWTAEDLVQVLASMPPEGA